MKNIFLTLTLIIFQSSFTHAQQAGSLDLSFDGDGKLITNIGVSDIYKNKMKVSADGKIVAVGSFNSFVVAARFNQDGSLDNTFGTNGVFNSANISGLRHIHEIVILQDNSMIVLIYSNDNTYGGCFIMKIKSNGIIDTSFGTNGIIIFPDFYGFTMELQSNGKIVIGGNVYIGSVHNLKVIRLNPNGTYDLSFGNDGTNNDGIIIIDFGLGEYFADFTIDKDGKIIIVGNGPNYYSFIAKCRTDGSLDTDFDNDGKLTLTSIELGGNSLVPESLSIQSDNQIIVVCSSNNILVFRLSKNGVLDTSYGVNGIFSNPTIGSPFDTQMQSDDKILVLTDNINQMCITRLNTNGSLDTSFDSDGVQCISFTPLSNSAQAYSLEIQSDGKIIFGGYFGPRFAFVRLHGVSNFASNQGKIPTQFTPNNDVANAIALRAGRKPIVVGNVTNAVSPTSGTDFGIVAYNADGSLDYTFGSNGFTSISFDENDRANAVAVQINGKILVAGKAANGSQYNLVVVRYNADGTLDNTFGIAGIATLEIDDFDTEATSIALQTDGKIVVAGLSDEQIFGNFYAVLARFNANGILDNTFGTNGVVNLPAGNGYIGKSLGIQSNGKIVIACANQSSVGNFVVIRCNSNGSLDNTFDTDGVVSTNVGTASSFAKSLVLTYDGRIIVCGAAKENSFDVLAMVAYGTAGNLDTSFDFDGIVLTNLSPIHATATAVAVQPNGRIYLTGNSTNTANADLILAKYTPNGILDQSFNISGKLIIPFGYGNEGTNAIISNSSGTIYLAGYYHNGHDNDFALVSVPTCTVLSPTLVLISPNNDYPVYPDPPLFNIQEAKNTIIATNRINQPSNVSFSSTVVTYRTSSSIILNPGFRANAGVVFKTEIVGCSY